MTLEYLRLVAYLVMTLGATTSVAQQPRQPTNQHAEWKPVGTATVILKTNPAHQLSYAWFVDNVPAKRALLCIYDGRGASCQTDDLPDGAWRQMGTNTVVEGDTKARTFLWLTTGKNVATCTVVADARRFGRLQCSNNYSLPRLE